MGGAMLKNLIREIATRGREGGGRPRVRRQDPDLVAESRGEKDP